MSINVFLLIIISGYGINDTLKSPINEATRKSSGGTSFHGTTFKATPQQLVDLFTPDYDANDGRDKTNFDFTLETENGDVFTIYDWKEYRRLNENEIVEWHVGGKNGIVTAKAVNEMTTAFNNIF